jgi:hypothetical protein
LANPLSRRTLEAARFPTLPPPLTFLLSAQKFFCSTFLFNLVPSVQIPSFRWEPGKGFREPRMRQKGCERVFANFEVDEGKEETAKTSAATGKESGDLKVCFMHNGSRTLVRARCGRRSA